MTEQKKKLVFYRAGSMAGAFAAYAVWRALGYRGEYVALSYEKPEEFLKYDIENRDVVLLGYSVSPSILTPELANKAKSIEMLDNRDGPIAGDWAGMYMDNTAGQIGYGDHVALTLWFDRSVSTMAWECRHAIGEGSPVGKVDVVQFLDSETLPLAFKYIEDRDMWRLQYEQSEPLHAYLADRGFAGPNPFFGDYEMFVTRFEERPSYRDAVISTGRTILKARDAQIRDWMARTSAEIMIAGYTVPSCCMPARLASRAGNLLAVGHPFSVTYWDDHALGVRKYELRRTQDSEVNLQEIAAKFGGGGRPNAAGFVQKLADIETLDFNV